MQQQGSGTAATLKQIIDAGGQIDDALFKRLLLSALVELQSEVGDLKRNQQRDWTPTITSVVIAVLTLAGAWALVAFK